MASQTDPVYLAIFIASLRQVSSEIDVIIFLDDDPISPQSLDIAKKYNITYIPFNLTSIQPSYIRHYHPSSLRWIFFYRLLVLHEYTQYDEYNKYKNNDRYSYISPLSDYTYVLFADVRDTYFQSNPFSLLPPKYPIHTTTIATATTSTTSNNITHKAHNSNSNNNNLVYNSKSIYVFEESTDLTLAQCGWNGKWVSDCFGQAVLDKIG